MKKTVTVNLDKTIFNIDDDAYTVLESIIRKSKFPKNPKRSV